MGFELFDTLIETPAPPKALVADDTEAHIKLKRNLLKALDRHDEFLSSELSPDMSVGDKRMVLEAATATVKAALTTDRTALKARQDNSLELVLLRALFHRKRLGYGMTANDDERLRNASRGQLEKALNSKQMETYDQLLGE